jgi:hypothetical protein
MFYSRDKRSVLSQLAYLVSSEVVDFILLIETQICPDPSLKHKDEDTAKTKDHPTPAN